jgi:very-short-patch-repair endonuclease
VVHTGPQLRQRAKEMRRAPTRSENRLWSWLRDRRFDGYKFRRQYPIGRYVLDFYCAELKLAIEVDGRHHEEPWMSD